jgi:hypothetical protein
MRQFIFCGVVTAFFSLVACGGATVPATGGEEGALATAASDGGVAVSGPSACPSSFAQCVRSGAEEKGCADAFQSCNSDDDRRADAGHRGTRHSDDDDRDHRCRDRRSCDDDSHRARGDDGRGGPKRVRGDRDEGDGHGDPRGDGREHSGHTGPRRDQGAAPDGACVANLVTCAKGTAALADCVDAYLTCASRGRAPAPPTSAEDPPLR